MAKTNTSAERYDDADEIDRLRAENAALKPLMLEVALMRPVVESAEALRLVGSACRQLSQERFGASSYGAFRILEDAWDCAVLEVDARAAALKNARERIAK